MLSVTKTEKQTVETEPKVVHSENKAAMRRSSLGSSDVQVNLQRESLLTEFLGFCCFGVFLLERIKNLSNTRKYIS